MTHDTHAQDIRLLCNVDNARIFCDGTAESSTWMQDDVAAAADDDNAVVAAAVTARDTHCQDRHEWLSPSLQYGDWFYRGSRPVRFSSSLHTSSVCRGVSVLVLKVCLLFACRTCLLFKIDLICNKRCSYSYCFWA